jgi:uncharacterized ferredoxin-like protein
MWCCDRRPLAKVLIAVAALASVSVTCRCCGLSCVDMCIIIDVVFHTQ